MVLDINLTDEVDLWKNGNRYFTGVYNVGLNNCVDFCNVLYINVRSLRNKLSDVEFLLNSLPFGADVVILTETWLRTFDKQFYNLGGYKSFHSIRSDGYGGCSIFVKEKWNTVLIYEEVYSNCNFVVAHIRDLNLNICGIYRSQKCNVELFLQKFELVLSKCTKCIVIGDINLNLMNSDSDILTYKEVFTCHGYVLLNKAEQKYATRVSNTVKTVIDHIATDLSNIKYEFCLEDTSISDHKFIYFRFQTEKIVKPVPTVSIKHVVNYDLVDRDPIWNSIDEINNFESLTKELSNVIQKCSVVIKSTVKKKFKKPWMTDDIYSCIRLREKFHKLRKKYLNSEYCFDKFEFYRRLCKTKINSAKQQYFLNIFENNLDKPNVLWKNFNKFILNRQPRNKIIELIVNGKVVKKDMEIAKIFNEYFINSVSDLFINMQFPSTTCFDYIHYTITQPFHLEDVSNRFIIRYNDRLTNKLAQLINDNVCKQTFPECLKCVKVCPIYKSGSNTEVANYRPISIPNSLTKIFENVINSRLQDFLDINNVISPYQFGFTKNSNTTAACLHLTNCLSMEIDKKNFVSVLFLDLSKAFDSINHKILLLKLAKLNMTDNQIKFFQSYLYNRKQFVEINGIQSNLETVSLGVLQGSILGPTLFKIFINDLLMKDFRGNVQMYADDIAIIYKNQDLQNLLADSQADLNLFNDWFKINLVLLNVKKTKYIIFENRTLDEGILLNNFLTYNGEIVERVSSYTYLGLVIDTKLKWNLHVDAIKKKIILYIYVLKKSKNVLPRKLLFNIYYAYIYSHLIYLNPIWSGTTESILDELIILQKRAIKFVLNVPIRTPSSIIFTDFLSLYIIIEK